VLVNFYDELIIVFGEIVSRLSELLAKLLVVGILLLGVGSLVLAKLAESPVEMDQWLDEAVSLL